MARKLQELGEAAIERALANHPEASNIPSGGALTGDELVDAIEKLHEGNTNEPTEAEPKAAMPEHLQDVEDLLYKEISSDMDGSTELVNLEPTMITAEVVDSIADAMSEQDRLIDKSVKTLELIDGRIARYETLKGTLDKLIENARNKRRDVEATHEAAQMARAMMEIKRVKR